MRRASIIISVIIVLSGIFFLINTSSKTPLESQINTVIFDNNITVKVEVVESPQEQALGLGGRETIGESEGMLFVYDTPKVRTFWMKGMHIPIDILWLSNGKVIGIEESVQPPKTDQEVLELYSSKSPIDLVLEVNAGLVSEAGITTSSTYILE